MITLFGYPSTRSIRVVWMMEELGEPYSYKLVDLHKGEGRSAEYLAVNPGGKVPAMCDGDLTLTESAAINTYLGDKFPQHGLVPQPGTAQRGLYDQWCHFAMSELEQPLWTIGKHKFAIPAEYRVKEIFPTAQWELQVALQLFSDGLGDKEFILGDTFTAADILLAQTLDWATAFKQDIPQSNLQAYAARMQERPALARAMKKEEAANQ